MNVKEWKILSDSMDNMFSDKNKTLKLKRLIPENRIKELDFTNNYKVSFIAIAISFDETSKIFEKINIEQKAKINSVFFNVVYKIFKKFKLQYIKIKNNTIYALSDALVQKDFDRIIDCSIYLNTFKQHLNKNIYHNILRKEYIDKKSPKFEYQIGVWYSPNNYLIKVNKNNYMFKSEAVNNAIYISNAFDKKSDSILFNKLVMANFSNEFKLSHKNVWKFSQADFNNHKVFGCSWVMQNYLDWIKEI